MVLSKTNISYAFTDLAQTNYSRILLLYSFAEIVVLCHFVVLAFLWLLRDPKFIPGWAIVFEKG